jgi:mannose-6-phosphate isomerase-like protein (cupin superfamily)
MSHKVEGTSAKTANTPFLREPGAGHTLNVLGVRHIYKAMATDTAASLSVWEDVVPPGGGAPPHTHSREDEAFFVLSGEIVVECESLPEPRRIGAGSFFYGARNKRHGYRNPGEVPAHLLVLCTPSVGLDTMFAELEAAGAQGKPDFETMAAITAKYGVTLAPPAA